MEEGEEPNPNPLHVSPAAQNRFSQLCVHSIAGAELRRPIGIAAPLLGIRKEMLPQSEETTEVTLAVSGCSNRHFGTAVPPGATEHRIGLPFLQAISDSSIMSVGEKNSLTTHSNLSQGE